MTSSIHPQPLENKSKRAQIVVVAQRHFGLYGFEKTTMNEIATDLSMSKGSLYYYFPDKEHLYMAVVEKEHNLFMEKVEEQMNQLSDPCEKIIAYVNTRLFYLKKLLNLSRLRYSNKFSELHKMMHQQWYKYKTQEAFILGNTFQQGIDMKIFTPKTVDEIHAIIELLLDTMKGLNIVILNHRHITPLNTEEFEELKRKENLLISILLEGLKNKR